MAGGAVDRASDPYSITREFEPNQRLSGVFLDQVPLPLLLSNVGSRNGYERDFTIEQKHVRP